VKKGNAATPQVRVKWVGLSAETSTWEDWYVLTTRFSAILSALGGDTGGVIVDVRG
jgi:hypothetical protein